MTLSLALRNSANQLRTERFYLRLRYLDAHQDWQGLSLGGPAGSVARANLASYTDWLSQPLQQMEQAAATFERHANLQARREELEERTIAFLGQVDERSGVAASAAGLLLNQVRALGDSLDWLCSQEIDALCTPAGVEPPTRFEDFSDLPLDTVHEINLAQANEHVAQLAAENSDMRVVEASEGRLVAMVDPGEFRTTPASLVTFVEGVHSSDPETWQRAVDRGRNLAKASGRPTVVWLGYQAPSSLPRAVHATPARTASQELVRFQRSLGARYPRTKRTVVGYSYGSVVTGHAAKEEKIADDIVLVGSPGVGASHSSELHGRIWAATNANDPIAIATGPHGGIHGPDPTTDVFGATPLPGADGLPGDHGTYWEAPRFLRSLGQVARAH